MDQVGNAMAEAVGTLLDNPIAAAAIRLAVAYVVLVWLAVALWSFVDMRRRTRNLVAAYASAAMVILASPVLFPFAVIVHRIVRPALEAETVAPRCPDCGVIVDDEWLVCPSCRRALGHHCQVCGRPAALDWDVCAWCGAELDGMHLLPVRAQA
jgi:hypothetical protein